MYKKSRFVSLTEVQLVNRDVTQPNSSMTNRTTPVKAVSTYKIKSKKKKKKRKKLRRVKYIALSATFAERAKLETVTSQSHCKICSIPVCTLTTFHGKKTGKRKRRRWQQIRKKEKGRGMNR